MRLSYFPDDERFWLLTLNKQTRLWSKLRPWQDDNGGRLPFTDGGLHYARARLIHCSEALQDDAVVDRAVRDHKQKETEREADDIAYRAKDNFRLMHRDKDLFGHKKHPKAKPTLILPSYMKGE